jgi:enoyl-CoA hydratase
MSIDRMSADTGTHRDFDTLRYETPAPGVARIVLDRPQARNAQNLALLYELNAAFDRAVADGGVRAIVLAASGPHFSSGHDLRERLGPAVPRPATVGTWSDFDAAGAHGRYAHEQELYLQLTRRWRELSKPTLAAVQGKCIAGGLMLAWACDLIVAADDAEFRDPVVAMGVLGVEWFAHPFELGARKAKELLFLAEAWSAEEAHRLGMVNRVVPRADLEATVLAMAVRIAAMPPLAVRLAKEAVNRAVDLQGQQAAIDSAFGLHHVCHAHNMLRFGLPVDPAGLPESLRPKEVR